MKRIFYYFAAGLMAVALLASCNKDPNEGGGGEGEEGAPVLGAIADAVLDAKGADIVVDCQPANFGVSAAVTHELWVAKTGKNMADETKINAAFAAGKFTMTQANLSLALQKLGFAVGDEAEVDFAAYGYLGSSRGAAALRSNLVKAKFTVCAAKQDDSVLDKIEVIGDFCSWSSEGVANAGAYLYKYGEEEVYSGLVYYAAKCVNGWKLRIPTADGNWDDSANWGIDENELANVNAQAKELYDSDPTHPEIKEITLACAGSSKDMKIFNHNFYYWLFDRSTALLKVDQHDTWATQNQPMAFDYMYLVGDFNSWKEFDENTKMKYIPKQHTFYLDVTLEEGKGLKFLADGQAADKWYLQWGIGAEDGKAAYRGDNITTPAGNVRVYFDYNHMEYSFDASAYGTEEEGGVDVAERALDRPDEYFIVGSIMGKTWDDLDLSLGLDSGTGIYTYSGLSYKVGDAFKVVKNQKAEWYGVGAMEPYTGTRNTLTGTDNFEFQKASGFDVSFNPTTGKVTIADSAIPGWGIKGNIKKADGTDDGWSSTFPMTQDGDIWTSETLEFMYDGTSTWGFKLCLYGNWAAGDIGVADGTNPQAGVAIPAVDKLVEGANSNINYNGKAVVQFDAASMTIKIIAK